ncbi:MAG: hypothetical protein UY87_C0025G0002 [Candidatus Peribacteria bacterium GW2011_GWC2_54_8]|nr:MAG: hypothetical protein UY87_C0025G0002 [Candidatus Peribacteria bacterium GW2011_GWC2_54_8]
MKIDLDKESKKTIILTSVSFFLFVFLIKASDMNLDRLVILQNQFMKVLFGSQPEFLSLSLILQLLLAMIFLTLSLAFLASYGAKKDKYQVGLVAAIISSIGLIAAIPTMLSLFIAAAVLVAFPFTVSASNTYYSELKKWKFFRIGSNAAGKALLIINLIVGLGILIAISLNSVHYTEIFKADIRETITSATLNTVGIDSPLVREQVERVCASENILYEICIATHQIGQRIVMIVYVQGEYRDRIRSWLFAALGDAGNHSLEVQPLTREQYFDLHKRKNGQQPLARATQAL